MKLYYSRGACSLTCRIIINELQLTCEYEKVDLKTKITEHGDNYLSINLKGSVPALETDDNKILTENAVILQYLADINHASTLLPPVNNFSRYRVLEWLNFVGTELHKGFGPLFNPDYSQEARDKIVIPLLKRKFSYVSKQLEISKFIVGDEFTLPDAYLFVVLRWAYFFKLDLGEQLSKYFSELSARKCIEKSLEEEGL